LTVATRCEFDCANAAAPQASIANVVKPRCSFKQ
jgi:hypothetical protein